MACCFEAPSKSPGVLLPHKILKESNLDGMRMEVRPMKNALIIISNEMQAMELIHAVESLRATANDLLDRLGEYCGKCDSCSGSGVICWADDEVSCPIEVPEEVLKEAGIPQNAKLLCDINEEAHTVTIWQDDSEYNLSDIPRGVLADIRKKGICIDRLEELLAEGEVIWDDE